MASTLPTVNEVKIYGLVDPSEMSNIRYVGKTWLPLNVRVRQHIAEVNRRNTPKNAWIKSLLHVGRKPIAVLLECVARLDWEKAECKWIAHYRGNGSLTNVTDGGDTGPDMSGYRHTDAARQRIAQTSKGRKWSDERKRLTVGPFKGRKHSPETIARIIATKRASGDMSWKKALAKAILVNLGRRCSEATREKIRAAQVGKRRSGSTRQASRKPVQCVETATWFTALSEASIRTGIGRTNIGNAIKSGGCAGGWHWQYADRR